MPGFLQTFKADMRGRFSGLTWLAAAGFNDPDDGPQGGVFSRIADVIGGFGGILFGMVMMAAFYGLTGLKGTGIMLGFGLVLGLLQRIRGFDDDTILFNFVGGFFVTGIVTGVGAYAAARLTGTAADCAVGAAEAALRAAYIALGGAPPEDTGVAAGKTLAPERAPRKGAIRSLLAGKETGTVQLGKLFNEAASVGGGRSRKNLQQGVSSAASASGKGTGTGSGASSQSFDDMLGLD
jgi:hypothetical protein